MQTLAPHRYATGDRVTLWKFPEDGVFTVILASGHNNYNSTPCYSIRDADGAVLTRVIESFLIPAAV